MELRFIARFAKAGVRHEIRTIMKDAKDILQHPHPFATQTVFKTDGRKIVAQLARLRGLAGFEDARSL
jgi:hypothetical protein